MFGELRAEYTPVRKRSGSRSGNVTGEARCGTKAKRPAGDLFREHGEGDSFLAKVVKH